MKLQNLRGGTLGEFGYAGRASRHSHLKNPIFDLKTCYKTLLLWENFENTERSFLGFL
jgi:hypothetical protein